MLSTHGAAYSHNRELVLDRIRLYDHGSRFEIVIPSRKYWPVMLFFAVWLIVWTVIAVWVGMIVRGIATGSALAPPISSMILLGAFLVFWTLVGWFARSLLLYMLFGRESIHINETEL